MVTSFGGFFAIVAFLLEHGWGAVGFFAGAGGGSVEGEGGEGGEWEGGVGGGAADDEAGGEGEDGGGVEGGAEGVGHGDFVDGAALQAGVEGFGDEDGARDGEVLFACDERRAGQVGRCADAFEDGGKGNE